MGGNELLIKFIDLYENLLTEKVNFSIFLYILNSFRIRKVKREFFKYIDSKNELTALDLSHFASILRIAKNLQILDNYYYHDSKGEIKVATEIYMINSALEELGLYMTISFGGCLLEVKLKEGTSDALIINIALTSNDKSSINDFGGKVYKQNRSTLDTESIKNNIDNNSNIEDVSFQVLKNIIKIYFALIFKNLTERFLLKWTNKDQEKE